MTFASNASHGQFLHRQQALGSRFRAGLCLGFGRLKSLHAGGLVWRS